MRSITDLGPHSLAAPEPGLFTPQATKLYLRVLDVAAGGARNPGPHQSLEIILRDPQRITAFSGPPTVLADWARDAGCGAEFDAALDRLTQSHDGLLKRWSPDRPLIVGIVNVSPDSFSGGSPDPATAATEARKLIAAGAHIIDIGGESTRPGATPVSAREECARVLPVIEQLADSPAPISIDTSKPAVMEAAIAAGATIINDVTALSGDAESPAMAARLGVPVILTHMQGRPHSMQQDPRYDCAPLDIVDELADRIAVAVAAGVEARNLIVDPGIGFGKTDQHNAAILARIGLLHGLGAPVMLGASRKSLIARLSRGEGPGDRLGGSLALALAAVDQGVQLLRVHDVAETVQALALRAAVRDAL